MEVEKLGTASNRGSFSDELCCRYVEQDVVTKGKVGVVSFLREIVLYLCTGKNDLVVREK